MALTVVAIDPSFRNTALVAAVLVGGKVTRILDAVTIKTEKTKNKQVRASSDAINCCRKLSEEVQEFIKKHNPAVVFAETPSGSQSASSMKGYGISCFLLATINPPPIEVTPYEVKMASVGKKTASKKEMIEWAFNLYPSAPWVIDKKTELPQMNQEHVADAMAVIHAGLNTQEFVRISTFYGG